MGLADLHIHTSISDGMMDAGALLDHVQQHTEFTVVAITDHDDINGGLLAKQLSEQRSYRFEVIVGAEITTREGHLLALFLQRPIPRLQSLADTLQAVHDQGGIAIIPHPMSWLTFSVGRRSIDRVLESGRDGVYFDGIETGNPTLAAKLVHDRVQQLNQDHFHLPQIGSSDAHFLQAVASGYTRFPGSTAADLRRAIAGGSTEPASIEMRLSDIGYGQLVRQQVQSLVVLPGRQIGRSARKLLQGNQ